MEDNDVFHFLEEFNELGNYDIDFHEMETPRRSNIYIRNALDPFQFYDDNDFYNRYRFSKDVVRRSIVPLITQNEQNSLRGLPIPVDIQILTALRFYATGSFQTVCGDLNYISQPTVSRIISNISSQLAARVNEYIKFPTGNELYEVKNQFQQCQSRYPGLRNIIGAIDCTHVHIKKPRNIEHSEIYRNRKGRFSINVQAVVGPTRKIFDIVSRWPGSTHDSRIFRNSRVHTRLESGQLQGVLVGDSGYRATHYMLTPYVEPRTQAEHRYNYVQVRTRNVVERTFGCLKKRFECLRGIIATKLTTTANIIVACAVLHNIAQDHNELTFEDDNYQEPMAPYPRFRREPISGLAFRSNIVNEYYDY